MNGIDIKDFLENETDINYIYNNSYPFLQNYIEGINMTKIGSNSINDLERENNKFYIITDEQNVSQKFIHENKT
jgi:hypothetical protein